jgi:hypothetical protein
LNSWSETFQSPGREKFVSKLKRAAYATATGLSKKGYGLDSPIREFLDMRLRGASMRSEPTPAFGRSANALVSDGMAAIVSVAKLVDAEISSSANQEKLRVSVTMVVLENMSKDQIAQQTSPGGPMPTNSEPIDAAYQILRLSVEE